MMDKTRVLEKIKKCLLLSQSSNAAESATALRQAKLLMDKYSICEADVKLSDIISVSTPALCENPCGWQNMLINMIGQYFGVMPVLGIGQYSIIGTDPKPVIAEHAYAILYQQIMRDRRAYIKSHLSRCKRANKTARANAYCEAWINAVANQVRHFAGISETDKALIDEYLHKRGGTETGHARQTKAKATMKDRVHGHLDGKKARLEHGLGQTETKRIEEC